MQSLKVEIGSEVKDSQGRRIQKVPFRECHSLVKGFIQLLTVQLHRSSYNIKDTTGTTRSISHNSACFACQPTTQTDFGILIGNGHANAVTMEDWKLESQIITNIAHQAVTFSTENPDSSTWRIAISRPFTNNTGSLVEVEEVALYVLLNVYYTVLADRTLYSVSFGNGLTLTLTYRITISL